MKNIKAYRVFELKTDPSFLELSVLTAEQRNWLDLRVDGTWRVNPETNLVDVDGDFRSVNLLGDLNGIKFGKVSGSFYVLFNGLKSLEGCPKEVGHIFNCGGNEITSLKGSPEIVGDSFLCSQNKLKTLEYGPKSVGRKYDCSENELVSLKGAPKIITGSFNCSENLLTSLIGSPKKIGGMFDFSYNRITSLEGSPKSINFYQGFICDDNPVSSDVLSLVFQEMYFTKITYKQALETYWSEIKDEDKILLYRPDFGWVKPDEAKRIEALRKYQKIKDLI